MYYIENVYICLIAPLLISIFWLQRGRKRMMIFLLTGMTVCLLSSYISTFIAALQNADLVSASINIAPIVEEIMKFLPVLFYLIVFEPGREKPAGALLMISIGFATFENVCYLVRNGAEKILLLLIRGFGTGTMHLVCGMIMSIGLLFLVDQYWIRLIGMVGLLALVITYHSIYNMLVSRTGPVAIVGYLIPILTFVIVLTFENKILR